MRVDTAPITHRTLLLLVALTGCGSATISDRREFAGAAAPAIVYVADFDLDAANVRSSSGPLPPPPALPGLPPLPGTPKDPRALARELIDTMSATIVHDLSAAGVRAARLPRASAVPATGWLVRGVFTTVDQGDRLGRAVVGFGAGKTAMQVLVDVADLAHGAPQPFYALRADADSGTAPGAGPTLVLGPAGVAARFALAGQDLDRDVRRAASQIAAELVQRVLGDHPTA